METIYQDTADRLMGICDDWTKRDIREHLEWLINNPDEISIGYDRNVFTKENIENIMGWVTK